VPRAELACCRVRDDGDVTAAQPSRAVLRLLSGPAVRAGHQLVYLHGVGNGPPTCRGDDVCVSGSYRVSWPTPQSETGTARANERLVVRGGDLSCKAETCRATQRLVVRGGNCSEGVPLVVSWPEILPTGREQDVLPVMVLQGPQSSSS
jgi:hypothetical protein